MLVVMGRIRVYFDADEELKVALKVAAARQGVSVSALIETLLKREFPKEVEEARKSVRDREKKPTK
jgi:predicted HicB family RNase H-like nuclease